MKFKYEVTCEISLDITASTYNRDINKRLARKLVWLRETSVRSRDTINGYFSAYLYTHLILPIIPQCITAENKNIQ